MEQPPVVNGAEEKVKGKSARRTRSHRANLTFPVGRIENRLRLATKKRITDTAAVYLTGVIQYIAREMLETAVESMPKDGKGKKPKRLKPSHIRAAVNNDSEFQSLLENVSIDTPGEVYKNKKKSETKKRKPKAK